MTKISSSIAVFLSTAFLIQPGLGYAQTSAAADSPQTSTVVLGPKSSAAVQARIVSVADEVSLTQAEKLALLQKKIKYVFVLFQENRSFDFYFGTFPGAHGLYSQSAAKTPGFVQPLVNTDGTVTTISPFSIPLSIKTVASTGTTVPLYPVGTTLPLYPADTDSVNHSHTAYETKIDLQNGVTLNDGYAITEEGVTLTNGVPNHVPTLKQKQMGELVMGHVDCNTAPVLWNYADRFMLFDDFHQTVLSASTPNAIAMIAGQSGETQWVKHPEDSTKAFGSISGNGVPVVSDGDPFWGSQLDMYGSGQPANPPSSNPQINLTFATLPLSFMGKDIYTTTAQDQQPQIDLTDVEKDIQEISGDGVKPTNWGWYQQGYDHEANDTTATASHADYIAHHNGPQYFGYVSNNPAVTPHLHGLTDFFTDIGNNNLAAKGGVYYLRGGYNNIQGLTPVDPNPALQTVFNGNDDHPGYSDVQISEALLAKEVNAIATSKYWPESAIIITYDETDGLYDHAPEVIRSYDPYGEPLDQGPRIPTIIMSPYGVVHGISHEKSEHSSIIKFIDLLYGLKPLADLPDEKQAREKGQRTYQQPYLGPADAGVPGVGNLFTAFDNNRLMGTTAVLPASYIELPTSFYQTLPQLNNNGCQVLNIEPTDHGLPNPVPADFNPRPSSDPGIPTSGNWTP
ncbi:MAG: phospholipase C [Janthinobacterium lividum]